MKKLSILVIVIMATITASAQYSLNLANGNLKITDSRNKRILSYNGVNAFQYDSTTTPKSFTFTAANASVVVLYTTIVDCNIDGGSVSTTPALTLANSITNWLYATTSGGGGGGGATPDIATTGNAMPTTGTVMMVDDGAGSAIPVASSYGVLSTNATATMPGVTTTDATFGNDGISVHGRMSNGTPQTIEVDAAGRLNVNVTPLNTVNGLLVNNVDGLITPQSTQSVLNNNILNTATGPAALDVKTGFSYKSFSCQITATVGISSGQVIFEGSNDNITFYPIPVYDDNAVTRMAIITATSITASTNRFFSGELSYQYVRCRISTAFVGGTVSARIVLSQTPFQYRNVAIMDNLGNGIPFLTTPTVSTLAMPVIMQPSSWMGKSATLTGQVSQSTLGNNIFNVTAGATSTDLQNGNLFTNNGNTYRTFYSQIIGTAGISSGAIIFEGSNDNTTFTPIKVSDEAVNNISYYTGPIPITASTNRYFSGNCSFRYVRCRISTAFAGGTVASVTTFSPEIFQEKQELTIIPSSTYGQTNATITTGGTSQVLLAANANRRGFVISNTSAGNLFVAFGVNASLTSGIVIPTNGNFTSPSFGAPTGAINIFGSITAQSYSVIEIQ